MNKIYSLLLLLTLSLRAFAQTDVTYKITNPSFENGSDGWTIDGLVPQTNTSFSLKDGKVYMEKWTGKGGTVGNASAKQTVKNLVKGKYQLSAVAQNIQQDKSDVQTGVSIWAKSTTNKVAVTKADKYTIDFDLALAQMSIGFTASNASGNWISLDDFRLTFVSTEPSIVADIIKSANEQLEKKINDKNINALKTAIANAQKAIDDNAEDLTGVAIALQDAIAEAKENASAYTSLKASISKAKLLVDKKTGKAEKEALNKALAEAENAIETTDNDPVELLHALQNAIEAVNTSTNNYKKLNDAIINAEPLYDSSKNGADEYAKVLDESKSMYENEVASNDEVLAQITAITKAKFNFQLKNATEGTGTAPSIAYTNHYVATGATEALMRADFKGDNLLEKGVCWSKEHNPTVLDNRTTKSFSLNGTIIHVKGLETATVYYLRPYAINKTYQVAYGDEVKIVTHPKGTCRGTWNEGAPTEEANTRCRNAINETIEYFNQWTGIKGFTLTGNYGSGTPTADCSYGGWMRIGPNAGNQAIGTVIHETGHGVGVGTSSRYKDTNLHNWKWYGREANAMYSFLENKEANPYTSDFCMVGDGTHAWGSSASYDWFVNGADKDKHTEIQYIGGCCLLYGFFIDGLNPTSDCTNGIAGYTYNFDDAKRYYIMNKDAERGLNSGLLNMNGTQLVWSPMLEASNELPLTAAWQLEYDPNTGLYAFRNAETGKFLSHSSTSMTTKAIAEGKKPATTEYFQLMPDRTDVTIGNDDLKTHGYWFTWNSGGNKSMSADALSTSSKTGKVSVANFDFSDNATKQQWIILSEDEIQKYWNVSVPDAIKQTDSECSSLTGIYSINGTRLQNKQKGINILRYSDGSTKKIMVK